MDHDHDHDHSKLSQSDDRHGTTTTAEEYESRHVHSVYEEIASHFSSTRYKPWPIVAAFLQNMPAGSVGLDAGCGNGKYLNVNDSLWIVGSDRSENLTRIAAGDGSSSTSNRPHSDAIVADSMAMPHSADRFDFAISIAVVHHLSTTERRVEALRLLLQVLKPSSRARGNGSKGETEELTTEGDEEKCGDDGSGQNGRLLVFVWALEQKQSRRGWSEGDEQDVMVPWVMKGGNNAGKSKEKETQVKGVKNGTENAKHDDDDQISTSKEKIQTFHRYYHLYRRGELERDLSAAGGRVLDSGYERDNWWAIAVRTTEA